MAKKETNETPKKKKPVAKKSTAKKSTAKKSTAKKSAPKKSTPKNEVYVPNLKKQYKEAIVTALMKRFDTAHFCYFDQYGYW